MTDSPVSDHSSTELNEEVTAEEVAGAVPPPPTTTVCRSVCSSFTAKLTAARFNVPAEYDLRAPAADETADSPPRGYAAICTHHFRYGLRLPLQPFVVSVLDYYRIALAQLHPHSIIHILGFLEVCKKASIDPSLTLFRHFFQLRRIANLKDESYIFAQAARLKIVYGVPAGHMRWKTYFLFFKTAPLKINRGALSWNHSPVVDEPVAEEKRPSAETVERLLVNYFEYQAPLAFQGEKRINELEVPIASSSKKKVAAQRTRAKKSANNTPAVNNGRLKRAAEPLATKAAKARRGLYGKKCVDERSQVPILKDMRPEQFDGDMDSEIPLLEGEIEELEMLVAPMEQGVKDTENETVLVQGGKEELDKVIHKDIEDNYVQDKGNLISSLQGRLKELESVLATKEQNVKDKDSLIYSLQGRLKDMENVSVAKEKNVLDKDNLISSLQGRLKDLRNVLAAKEQNVKDKDGLISSLQGRLEDLENVSVAKEQDVRAKGIMISSLEKAVVAKEQDVKVKDSLVFSLQGRLVELEKVLVAKEQDVGAKDNEIASLQGDKDFLEKAMVAMEHDVKVKEEETSLLKNVCKDEIASVKAKVSRLRDVVDDRGPLLKVYTWKLLKTEGFASFLYKLTFLAQSLGRNEAAELMLDRFPTIPEEALVGLQDPQAAFKLDNQLFDMIQDDAFDFPLLDHLLSLDEIPCSSQLKHVDVDEDEDAFIAPSPPRC